MTLAAQPGAKACCLIPCYDPKRLLETVDALHHLGWPVMLAAGQDLESTVRAQLEKRPGLHLLSLPEKHHPSEALALCIKTAFSQGYGLAVSLHAVGGYDLQDTLRLLAEAQAHPDTMVIAVAECAGKKPWKLVLSNFWFWMETGLNLEDSLSSFRVYPVPAMHAVQTRFSGPGWEIEALVRAVWGGVRLASVPVAQVAQGPEKSGTNAWWRLMGMHAYLVLRRLLPIPFRPVVPKTPLAWPAGWKARMVFFWKKFLWNPDETPGEIAVSIGFGVGIGLSPFWGWHTLLGLYLSQRLHLNTVLVVLASYISIPPTLPFILYGSFVLGRFAVAGEWRWGMDFASFQLAQVQSWLLEFFVGSLILAMLGGLFAGFIAFGLLRWFRPAQIVGKPTGCH